MRTLSTIKKAEIPGPYIFANQTYIAAGAKIFTMSKDRRTFIGGSTSTVGALQTSTNVDTSTTPTWTTQFTFGAGLTLNGAVELANGEVLVSMTQTGNGGVLYVSNGWAANPATATWSKVMTAIGGSALLASYCMHQFSNGTDGVIVASESGAQTVGGSGNQTADLAAARRVYLSRNFGVDLFNNSTPIFDIYTYGQSRGVAYPAGVHIHGVAYDQDDGRVYVCYGDDTGDAGTIAGAGFAQAVYSDDFGATWNRLPMPLYWPTSSHLQYLNPSITKAAVLFTPDVSNPSNILIYPKLGYRQLGQPRTGPNMGLSGVAGTSTRVDMKSRSMMFFSGQVYGTFTGDKNWSVPTTDDDGLTWSTTYGLVPAQTPAITSFGFNAIWGPTINGKIVGAAGHYINNDTTKKTMIADLQRPAALNDPFIPVTPITAAYTITADDAVIPVDATAGTVAITLPPVTTINKLFTVKKTDASVNTVTIAGLDGGTTMLAVQNAAVSFVSNGSAFIVVGKV